MFASSFLVLAFAVHGPNTLQVDQDVSDWVQSFTGDFASRLASLGDALGWWTFSMTALVVAWVGLAVTGQRRELWFVLIAAVGRLCAMPFKEYIDSPRPTVDQVILHGTFDNNGFPSGHTMTSAIVLGSVAFILARRLAFPYAGIILLVCWILGTSLTAFARIWQGAHWFTDTLGGALYGATVVLVAANLSATITARRSSARQTPPPQMKEQ